MYFIIGKDISTAIVEGRNQGWRRSSATTFRDKDLKEIRVVKSASSLRGFKEVTIYLGKSFRDRRSTEQDEWHLMFRNRKATLIYL